MSLWSRISDALRPDRLSREIDEELASHIDGAIAHGRDPAEARRAFGSALRTRERSLDIRALPWLDSLRADAIFAWRQLMKRKLTSAAAVLSLALAIGACTSAFRLIDALLLRPLPVTEPGRLFSLYRQGTGFDGKPSTFDGWAYPAFQRMRAAVKGKAELIAVSYLERVDLTFKSDREIEKANLHYVSGWMFPSFGLQPAQGRLFTEDDDLKPGAHPLAVLSYDYWTRRFARDPGAVGRTFRMGDRIYTIVGVGPQSFTGTETGAVTDIFLPAMMHPGAVRDDQTWIRTLAQLNPGIAPEPVRAILHATSRAFELERARGFTGMTKQSIDRFLNQTLLLESASAGASGLQKDYRRSLMALGLLVALVLLIACANLANLMTAQGRARAREMALRISIGAGRWRLAQLVFVESAIMALLSAAIGTAFAAWAVPFVVARINPPDNPARLPLAADWRVLAFSLGLAIFVTILFGLAPALRAWSIAPATALRGGSGPRSPRRSMNALIAVQAAFCFVVLFVAGLFTASFDRLANRPIGFSTDRLLVLSAVAARPQPTVYWDQLAEHLRTVPGVQKVALAGWPLLTPNSWNGFISVNGAPPGPALAYFLPVSPGWIDTMKIAFTNGRDFRPNDTTPGAAIVNETFARVFFQDAKATGRQFARGRNIYRIVGIVRDAPYRHIREGILPVAYVPFQSVNSARVAQPVRNAAIVVRTLSADPLTLASVMRREVPAARPEFRVNNVTTQAELFRSQTLRERLLAMLGLFFAGVALLLAGVGLYGVLDYSVLQQRREIGIRMAIGAHAAHIVRRVTTDVFLMLLVGAAAGLALGMASVQTLEALLYQVKATDPPMLVTPSWFILGVALLAAVTPVLRAVRIDPASVLRSE